MKYIICYQNLIIFAILCLSTNLLIAQDKRDKKSRLAFNKEIRKERKKVAIKYYGIWDKPPIRIDTVVPRSPNRMFKPHTINIYSPKNSRKILVKNVSSSYSMTYYFIKDIIYVRHDTAKEGQLLRINRQSDEVKRFGLQNRSTTIIDIDTLGVYLKSECIRCTLPHYEYFFMPHSDTTTQKIPLDEAIIHLSKNHSVVMPSECYESKECEVIIKNRAIPTDTLFFKIAKENMYEISNYDSKYWIFGKSKSFYIFNKDFPQKSEELAKQIIENKLSKYIKYKDKKSAYTYQDITLINGKIFFLITMYNGFKIMNDFKLVHNIKEFVVKYDIEKQHLTILHKFD